MFRSSTSMFVFLIALCVVSASVHALTCNLGRYATASGCRKCPEGKYSDEMSNATSCTPCEEGTYAAVRGVVSSFLCMECPEDSKSSKGSAKCTPCESGMVRACENCVRCPPGTYVLHYGSCSCQKCEKGLIAPGWNTDFCESCPQGLVSNPKRTKCVPAKCDPGYEHDGYECVACDYNTYRSENMASCEECPFGFVTDNFSGPNKKCIQCPAGFYTSDLLPQTYTYEGVPFCAKCPPNSTTNGVGKTLCRRLGSKCALNSIQDSDGDCKTCDYNYRMDFATGTCIPCAEGYVSQRGAFEKCTKCPEGAVASYYDRCACREGFGLQGGNCIACEKGTVSSRFNKCGVCGSDTIAPRAGMSKCVACPEGTRTIGSDRTKCLAIPKCKPGFYFGKDISVGYYSESECISMRTGCADGLERILRKGASVCVDSDRKIVCPPGSIYDNVSKCVTCGVGSYVAKVPGSIRLKCKMCGLRTISNGGASRTCTPCPAGFSASKYYDDDAYCYCKEGKYIRESDGTCVGCATGSVSNVWNSTSCDKCDKGFMPDYYKRECVCTLPKIIDRLGNCVEESNPLEYDR